MAEPVTPTAEQVAAMTTAVILKATRFLTFPGSPLGTWGEAGEGGIAVMSVRPDHQVKEVLYGLGGRNWDVDLTSLVEPEDVIREGLDMDPSDFPQDKIADVERAIGSAASWVANYLLTTGFAIGGI